MDSATLERLRREYLENRIRSAPPIEIVTMLYDVAIDSLKAAIEHLQSGDRLARSREISRAEQAVHELLVALDHSSQAPFTHTLSALYRYCLNRMIEGHATQSEQAFREALSVLSTLAVAWQEIKAKECEASESAAEIAGAPVQPEPFLGRYSVYQPDSETPAARNWSC